MPPPRDKITFVLSPEKVVRVTTGENYGECLACEAKGFLMDRLGTLWEVGHTYLFQDILVHRHWCPMNRVLFHRTKR